jgi:hypothetical protein
VVVDTWREAVLLQQAARKYGSLAAMENVTLFFRLLPYLGCISWGIYSVLEVYFPSLRDPDFNRWEVDEGSGSSIQILGWRKVLTPPRVLAQGYLSDSTACAIALIAGAILIFIGMLGIRHVSGLPEFLPDLFGKF